VHVARPHDYFKLRVSLALASTNNNSNPNSTFTSAEMSSTLIEKMTAEGSGEQAGEFGRLLE
jgi:hypothetical protein